MRVANWAVRRQIGSHAAVDHRSVYALRDRSSAFEQSDTLVVVPIRRSCPLRVVSTFADPGGDRRARVHESSPFQGRAVGVDRVVDAPRLAACVGRVDLAILIAKSASAVPQL